MRIGGSCVIQARVRDEDRSLAACAHHRGERFGHHASCEHGRSAGCRLESGYVCGGPAFVLREKVTRPVRSQHPLRIGVRERDVHELGSASVDGCFQESQRGGVSLSPRVVLLHREDVVPTHDLIALGCGEPLFQQDGRNGQAGAQRRLRQEKAGEGLGVLSGARVSGGVHHEATFRVGQRCACDPHYDDHVHRIGLRVVHEDVVGHVPLADLSFCIGPDPYLQRIDPGLVRDARQSSSVRDGHRAGRHVMTDLGLLVDEATVRPAQAES